jgi:hypothetical protein
VYLATLGLSPLLQGPVIGGSFDLDLFLVTLVAEGASSFRETSVVTVTVTGSDIVPYLDKNDNIYYITNGGKKAFASVYSQK